MKHEKNPTIRYYQQHAEELAERYEGAEVAELHPSFEHLHRLLKQDGKLLFSVPLNRPGLDEKGYDEKGRYYLLLSSDQWIDQAETAGFHSISSATTGDGLGRETITWLTCVVEK